ncbi:MAG: hypothetical protein JJ913_00110 [Rhizobiaceae bacterium]|nr:hypothetical protein [Rhizobiaceae bacterium]
MVTRLLMRLGAVWVASSLWLAGAATPSHAFLEALWCEMDPLYDLCLTRRIEQIGETLPPGATRDRSLLRGFAGWYFSSRSADEIAVRSPDPSYYRNLIGHVEVDALVTAMHQIIYAENPNAAEATLAPIQTPAIRLIAERMVARSYLFVDDRERALQHLSAYREAIGELDRPQRKVQPLAELAWFSGQAGDEDGAREALNELLAIAASHPIAQLRPIFAIEAAPVEFLLDGEAASLARIDAALAELNAMTNLPPGMRPHVLAQAAKSYGRIGRDELGRPLASEAMSGLEGLETGMQLNILWDIFNAGFDF